MGRLYGSRAYPSYNCFGTSYYDHVNAVVSLVLTFHGKFLIFPLNLGAMARMLNNTFLAQARVADLETLTCCLWLY